MFQFRKDPIKIEPDLELQIEVIQNNPDLSDKDKKKQIKKLRWEQTKQAMKGKGGIK